MKELLAQSAAEELVFISLLAAGYTLCEAGHMGSAWRWEGATAALLKSSLVAFSSVFCEHTYKSNSFLVVLALQVGRWGPALFRGVDGYGMAYYNII